MKRSSDVDDLHRDLEEAFEVHQAMVIAERCDLKLRKNARWQLLRMDAYEEFRRLYDGEAAS